MGRLATLGYRWDEHPGSRGRRDPIVEDFVDAVVEKAKEMGVPFPVLRERIAASRRSGLNWLEIEETL